MAKKKRQDKRIVNRRARYDYELEDTFLLGIQLTGSETKSLRHGLGQLRGAYITVKDSELWLINAMISPAQGTLIDQSDQSRTRKLLAKRREIDRLIAEKQIGRTIVPLELITTGRFIKLRAALGKGKKKYDKRESLKRRQQEREIARQQG